MGRAYKNPTEDMALGHIMLEEKINRQREMRESKIETAFVEAVKTAGGAAYKFISPSLSGVPDRIMLFKYGKCAFVELKAQGEPLRPQQRKRREVLMKLGFPVFCVDSIEQIQPVIDAMVNWYPGEPIPTGVGAKVPALKRMQLSTEAKGGGGGIP